jgi:quercetin dioxygenase-like cupin family protein
MPDAARSLVVLCSLLALDGCARRGPRLTLPRIAGGVEAFVAAHPLAPGQNIRADEVGRTASASYHLVQVRGGESPHRHLAHDLTVVVLDGGGSLDEGERRVDLAAGDVAVIPRGDVHWFTNLGRGNAVAFVIFSPPLDAPDNVPATDR